MNRATSKRRLLKLAEFLRALPAKRFSYGDWFTGDLKKDCGTSACAMGWATQIPSLKRAVWYKKWDGKDETSLEITLHGEIVDPSEAAAEVFGIEEEQANYLFLPGYANEFGIAPNDGATAKQVAKHIEKFVAKHL